MNTFQIFLGNDTKPKEKETPVVSHREHTVQPKPLPLPPDAEIQLELQEHEMLKLERFGKILAGPNTDLGITKKNLYGTLFESYIKVHVFLLMHKYFLALQLQTLTKIYVYCVLFYT